MTHFCRFAILISGFIFSASAARSQNCIPNWNFEAYTTCPTGPTGIYQVIDWSNPTNGSPDYYNTCDTTAFVGVPVNFAGYENTHSGNGYMGIIIKNWGSHPIIDWREYIQAELTVELQVNRTYYLSLFVSLADTLSQYGSDAIGALFTTYPLNNSSHLRINIPPQALNQAGNFITNKNGWTRIVMPFFSDSSYKYITIGNFFDDANTSIVPVSGGLSPQTYIYIDDICLSDDSTFCNTFVSISEAFENSQFDVYPNPFSERLTVVAQGDAELILYDIFSNELLRNPFSGKMNIDATFILKGIYIYEIRNKHGRIKAGRLIKY